MSNFIDRFKGKTSMITKEGLMSSLSKSPSSSNSYVIKQQYTPLSESRFIDGTPKQIVSKSNPPSTSEKPFFAQNGAAIISRTNNPSKNGSLHSFTNSNSTNNILGNNYSHSRQFEYLVATGAQKDSYTPLSRYTTESSNLSSNRNLSQFTNPSLMDISRTTDTHQKHTPLSKHLQSKKKLDGIVEQWIQEQSMLVDSLSSAQVGEERKTGSGGSSSSSKFSSLENPLQQKNRYIMESNLQLSRQLAEPKIKQMHNPYTLESLHNLDKEKATGERHIPASQINSKEQIKQSVKVTQPNWTGKNTSIQDEQEKDAKSYLNSYLPSFEYVNDSVSTVTPVSKKNQNSSRMQFEEYMTAHENTSKQPKQKAKQQPLSSSPSSIYGGQPVRKQSHNETSSRSTKGYQQRQFVIDSILNQDTLTTKRSPKSNSQPNIIYSAEESPINKYELSEEQLEASHLGFLNRIENLHTNS